MKRLRHILNAMVWTMIGLYLAISILLHIPTIQEYMGERVACALQDKFGTKTSVGKINLGFLNRIIIDDFSMLDKENKQMINAARLSLSINLPELIRGKIYISSAQVFGLKANIYKKKATDKLNCQFVIDSLSTGSKSESELDLCINTFIIRNGAVRYDRLDVAPTPHILNPDHVCVENISANIMVRHVTNHMVDAAIKKLSFDEASGLSLKNFSLNVFANDNIAKISNLRIELPHSIFSSDSITASYVTTPNGIDYDRLKASGNLKAEQVAVKDFAFLVKQLKNYNTKFSLHTTFSCANGKVDVNDLRLSSLDNALRLSAKAFVKPFMKKKEWGIWLREASVTPNGMKLITSGMGDMKVKIPSQLSCLKTISASGKAKGKGTDILANADIRTNVGNMKLNINKVANRLKASVSTDGMNLREITADNRFGNVALNLTATGNIDGSSIRNMTLHGTVSKLEYNRYKFSDIGINGEYSGNTAKGLLSIKDANCNIEVEGKATNLKGLPTADITATIIKLNPARIGASNKWGDATFSAHITAHATGNSMKNLHGKLQMSDFLFSSPTENYGINRLEAMVSPREIHMTSDFGSLNLTGNYNPQSLVQSMLSILKSKLPTIPGLEKELYATGNDFSLTADVTDTKWLNTLLAIPFNAEKPIHLTAKVNDADKYLYAYATLPEFSYDGNKYDSGLIDIDTKNDTLFANVNVRKLLGNGNDILLKLKADAANNRLNGKVSFDYNTPTRIKGEVETQARFYKDPMGNNTVTLDFKPSSMAINDTTWTICPSSVIYNDAKIQVNHFAIERGRQHIRIDGTATKSQQDSICVDLQDVDVNYILNLVDFHSVTFSGRASGKAYLKSVLYNPDAYANLTVDQFEFQDGHMGKLYANVTWNKQDKQIDIDAHADEDRDAKTIIKGYVSPERNYIDLGITAENTNIEFLQSFCSSFMDNINARCKGFAQVYGDLSEVNLRGLLVADGSLRIKPLNTVYNLRGDTIRMIPDEIIFNGDTVTDRNGNIAIVTGALHHKHLTKLTYDLDINTENFLCYDTDDYGNETFYGTVYGTGSCTITGRPHNIMFDIDLTPQKGSFIEYNATSPDAITSRDFITWVNNDKADEGNGATQKDSLHAKASAEMNLNDASDMRINVNINTNPDFTLRVLMDQMSGDKISLNGSGAIKATYFNKGSFDMFGTYLIDHGSYNLTIQNIIKKDFQFQQGSTIVFGGNPFNALLNLKAVYPVNGVSLADLKIGNSFTSNNVRVDCIMNIGGTPEAIRVDFDFDMPTVNNDAKQMVRSLINSEEEMNQQVVYLLAIGRFIADTKNNSTQEDAQQSQTSLAMQSLLSGTISQQVNTILGTLINNNNWNFGTNISTGTEGFNNAEYEGLLSGRLFSNRLLINGQFGYRDNPNTTSSFIGDFDVKYLLTPSGNVAIKVYNQTNDRYFTKSSLNTQGLGIILKRDFINWRDLFKSSKKKDKAKRK